MTSLVDRREVEKLLVIGGALRAGIIDVLAGPRAVTADEVAERLTGDPRACRVMLEALVSLGVALRQGDAFALTEAGRVHLVEPPEGTPRPPELERSSILHQLRKARGMMDLPEIVRTGRPPERLASEGDLRSFCRTMAEGDPERIAEVVDAALEYALPMRIDSMIDVGGAVGHVALAYAARGIRATLFDRPEVLPEARAYLGSDSLRVERASGDFTVALPPGPYDLAYLGNITHIYGPAVNAALVARVAGCLSPGGVIVIRDFVWERSPRAALFAVNMLQATLEGGVWREDQYRGWLGAAGFVDVRVRDLARGDNQLVMGRRPTR